VWWYLDGELASTGGQDAGFYWVAIAIRVAAELYLCAVVARDVWWPRHDPVHQAAMRTALRDAPPPQPISTASNTVAV